MGYSTQVARFSRYLQDQRFCLWLLLVFIVWYSSTIWQSLFVNFRCMNEYNTPISQTETHQLRGNIRSQLQQRYEWNKICAWRLFFASNGVYNSFYCARIPCWKRTGLFRLYWLNVGAVEVFVRCSWLVYASEASRKVCCVCTFGISAARRIRQRSRDASTYLLVSGASIRIPA